MNNFNETKENAAVSFVLPGATVGIIGGGQLGQMMASAAVSMGYRVVVLDPVEGCPASLVATDQIIGAYDDHEALAQLAKIANVVTYEFENVNAQAIERIAEFTYIPQGTKALQICQNRLAEKEFLAAVGIPIAPYEAINNSDELFSAVEKIGFPCVLKTVRGGYDGKGQVVLHSSTDTEAWQSAIDIAAAEKCVLESWIVFDSEASVIVGRNRLGQVVSFPLTRNIHRNNILHQSITPAPDNAVIVNQARMLALRIAEEIDLVGVMGVEMFISDSGELYVNELAPRPHNSGHYTIEACDYSQFEAHIRGVCGWPLSHPRLLSPAVMTNVLGQHLESCINKIASEDTWSFHFYGKKEAQQNRKMGHVTLLDKNVDQALEAFKNSQIWD